MSSKRRYSDSSSSSSSVETSDTETKVTEDITIGIEDLSFDDDWGVDFKIENVVKSLYKHQLGSLKASERGRISEQIITEKLKNFYVYAKEDGVEFDRRITALQFHPKDPNLLSIGSDSGKITIRSIGKPMAIVNWDGIGYRGSITYIKFDPLVSNSVLMTSVGGTALWRYNYKENAVYRFLYTGDFTKYFCSINASKDYKLTYVGDAAGTMGIIDPDNKLVGVHKIHEGKINSLEIPKGYDWLLASASQDKTVKIWDIRKIKPRKPLHELPHNRPVSSANFSEVDSMRLLTTDDSKQLRVYKGALLDLETVIVHPHRRLHHMIPIKATWHPLSDMIIVGRYPDPGQEGYVDGEVYTVDIVSAESGLIRLQLDPILCGNILNLNAFNSNGEILASTMGQNILYWKARNFTETFQNNIDNNRDHRDDEGVISPSTLLDFYS
nr:DNA damage-binding protein 2-like [Halyomorpha halys]